MLNCKADSYYLFYFLCKSLGVCLKYAYLACCLLVRFIYLLLYYCKLLKIVTDRHMHVTAIVLE
jgi:hypothetical protein